MRIVRRAGARPPDGSPIPAEAWAAIVEAEVVRRGQRLAKILKHRAQLAEVDRCSRDPLYWLRNYGWLTEPRAERPEDRKPFPLILWPAQVKLIGFLLDGLRKGRPRLVNKSRAIGASWLAVMLCWWLWRFEAGFQARLFSRKEDLVDNRTPDSLFGKLRFTHRQQPLFMRPRLATKVHDKHMHFEHPDNGSLISGESTNRGAARGGRATVVIRDEWAAVPPADQQAIHVALESVARSDWILSTPNGRGDNFHALWLTSDAEDKLELDWRTDPRATEEWFVGLLQEHGGRLTWDEREQERNCSFAGVSGHRIIRLEREAVTYTDESFPLIHHARRQWLLVGAMDFGSGPSWTVFLALLVNWDQDASHLPMVYVDAELVWQRQPAHEIAATIVGKLDGEYGHNRWITGDPAGRNAESDQESWQSNLGAAGLPIGCLPAEYNAHPLLDETIKDVQTMLDLGRLKIHADRCPLLLTALESWQWDLPKGVPLELANKLEIKPRKDAWSHPGDALRYGLGAALRLDPRASSLADVVAKLPKAAGGELADLYAGLLQQG